MLNFFILQPKVIHEKLEKLDFSQRTHLFFPLSRIIITSWKTLSNTYRMSTQFSINPLISNITRKMRGKHRNI